MHGRAVNVDSPLWLVLVKLPSSAT